MFCTNCGKQNEDSTRFCPACGTPTALAATEVALVPPVTHHLHRVRSQKKIAGVCAGFAEYFDMDLTLVRVIWLVLTICPPSIGLIAYFVCWIVLSYDD